MNWMIVVGYKGENYDAEYDFVLEYPKEEANILTEAIENWIYDTTKQRR